MLMITGLGRARAGRRSELVAAAAQVAQASRDDDGCLSYGFYNDIEEPDTLLSLEVWRDEAALAAHMGHEHTTAFLALAADLLDGTPVMEQHTIGNPDPRPAADASAPGDHPTPSEKTS